MKESADYAENARHPNTFAIMNQPKRPVPPAAFKPYGGRIVTPPAALTVQAQRSVAMPKPQQANWTTSMKPPTVPRPASVGKVMPPAPFRPQHGIAAVQKKSMRHQAPQAAAVLIQRAYATGLLHEVKDAGARLGAKSQEWVDIDTVKRSVFTWFSKPIQEKLAIESKPANGSICPMCGKSANNFELDHMTPWRHYIAALSDKRYINSAGEIRADVAKSLYNDPENLWWICHDCNNPKTDIIPETDAHARGDFSSGTTGRKSDKPSTFLPS